MQTADEDRRRRFGDTVGGEYYPHRAAEHARAEQLRRHQRDHHVLATEPDAWVLHPGETWHGFSDLEGGYCMLDPIKVSVITPGVADKGGLDKRGIPATLVTAYEADYFKIPLDLDGIEEYSPKQLKETIAQMEADMRFAAKEMKFERAAEIRDRLKYLRERELEYR